MRTIVLSILLLTLSGAISQEEDINARVQLLEMQVRQLTDEVIRLRQALQIQQKVTEQLSIAPPQERLYDEVIESFRQGPLEEDDITSFYRRLIHSHIWLGGHLELKLQETESTDDPDLFDLSGFAFTFRSSLNEYFSIHGEIGFSEEEEVNIHHGYLIVSLDPSLSLKAGMVRVPFGRYNSSYSPPSQNLSSIPLVDYYIIPTVWGDPGLSLFGQLKPTSALTVSYEVLMSNGFGEGGFNADEGNREARQGLRLDNNHEPQWSARVELVPDLNVEIFAMSFGVSGIIGRYDDEKKSEFKGGSLDGFLGMGPFTLTGDHDELRFSGEYAYLDIERDMALLQRHPTTVRRMWGYYLEAHYQFFPEPWRGSCFLFGEESAFGLSFRYERMNLAAAIGIPKLDQRIYTVGFDFRPIAQTIFRVEYNWIREHRVSRAWNNRVLASFATHF